MMNWKAVMNMMISVKIQEAAEATPIPETMDVADEVSVIFVYR